ncbi:MAG: N(4)-(beta-N-acetylglucosaminyl)-L-asparaginase [Phycisphaerales bacterium]|nr:N(4)-(beta-N-acetylglucosaminyl)-L-asparaginase [Phycisphaerales bacterium]
MAHPLPRRDFLALSALAAAGLPAAAHSRPGQPEAGPAPNPGEPGDASRLKPVVIASGNGLAAVNKAMEMLRAGADPCDAVVNGVKIIEDDPNDNSVGYGGLPNEEGIVELDASVMHGPTHKAGAVASLRNIKNPAAVALLVLRKTNHALLVGEGALKFARSFGFAEENLLTEESRQAWLRWRANRGASDDWLDDNQTDDDKWGQQPVLGTATLRAAPGPGSTFLPGSSRELLLPGSTSPIPYTTGTVHCAALTAAGDLGATTSTSGLSWKIPGRVGDSPIIGAGMYVANDIGAAGATGRGESVIQNCGSFAVVQLMAAGQSPTEACLNVLKRIADRTLEKRHRDEQGRPKFNVTMYALRKDGAFGSACLWKGGSFAVHDGTQGRVIQSAYLYGKQ